MAKVQVEYITQNVAMMSFMLSYNRLNRRTPLPTTAIALVSYLFSKWNETAFEELKMWYWTEELETSRKTREDDGFCMSDDAFVVWINKLQTLGLLEYDNKAHRSRPYSTVKFFILDRWYKAWKDRKYIGGEFYSFLVNEGAIPSPYTEEQKQPQPTPPAPAPKEEDKLLTYFKEELQRKAANLDLPLILFTKEENKAALEIMELVTVGMETDSDKEAKIWGFCGRAGENAIAGNGYLKSKFFPTAMLKFLAAFNAQPHQPNPYQRSKTQNEWIEGEEMTIGFVHDNESVLFPFPNDTQFRKAHNMKKNVALREKYVFFLNSQGCFFNRATTTFEVLQEDKIQVGKHIQHEEYVWQKVEGGQSGQKWIRLGTIEEFKTQLQTQV